MKTLVFTATTCLSGLAMLAASAAAQPILTSFNPIDTDPTPNFFVGYQFSLSEEVTIGGLGAYDHDGDGLAVAHRVGLYDEFGARITLVTVLPGDRLVGLFRYAPVTLTLPAGDYFVMADVLEPDPYTYEADTIVTDPRVAYLGSYFSFDGTPSGAFQSANTREYMSANIHIGALPPAAGCPGDADGNGSVNFADITNVLTNFNLMCP